MTIDTKDVLNSILAGISGIDYIKAEDIPNIDLYMDQVTTFMESHLASTKRYPDDKVLTKTMINNYAKNHLLPPPVKKKYSKEHLLMMTFIYYFKNIMSINDIQTLLAPLAEKFFSGEGSLDLTEIYEEIMHLGVSQIEPLAKDVTRKFHRACDSFSQAEPEEQEFLQQFSFVCMLILDVYIKKEIIETLIDQMPKPETKDKKNRNPSA